MSDEATKQEGDVEIVCSDCRRPFTFTVGEATFMRETFGDDFHPPKRCKECRQARKAQKDQAGNHNVQSAQPVEEPPQSRQPKRQRSRRDDD